DGDEVAAALAGMDVDDRGLANGLEGGEQAVARVGVAGPPDLLVARRDPRLADDLPGRQVRIVDREVIVDHVHAPLEHFLVGLPGRGAGRNENGVLGGGVEEHGVIDWGRGDAAAEPGRSENRRRESKPPGHWNPLVARMTASMPQRLRAVKRNGWVVVAGLCEAGFRWRSGLIEAGYKNLTESL